MMKLISKRYIRFSALAAAVCAFVGCSRLIPDGPMPGNGSGPVEGCDLTLDIDLSAIKMDIQTRSLDDSKIGSGKIESLAMFIIEDFGASIASAKLVGFRLFLPNGYYYRNIYGEVDDEGVPYEDVRGTLRDDVYSGSVLSLIADDRVSPNIDDMGNLQETMKGIGFQGFVDKSGNKITKYYSMKEEGITDGNFTPGAQVSADAAIASFSFKNPMHGHTEKLRPGKYKLVAIANFHEANIVIRGRHLGYWVHDMLQKFSSAAYVMDGDKFVIDPATQLPVENLDFEGIDHKELRPMFAARSSLNDMKVTYKYGDDGNLFDPGSGIPGASSREDSITPKDPSGEASFIRKANTLLTCTYSADFELKSQETYLNVKLERMSPRISFRVQNSSNHDLMINKFSLSDNFAQAGTYIFPSTLAYVPAYSDVLGPYTEEDRFQPHWRGAPLVTSDRAIVPFDRSRRYSGDNGVQTFFDCLTYETSDPDNPLTFSMELEYPEMVGGKATSITYKSHSIFGQEVPADPQPMLDAMLADLADSTSGHYYLISRTGITGEVYMNFNDAGHRYDCWESNSVANSIRDCKSIVFQFKPVMVDLENRTARVLLKNMASGQYVVAPTSLSDITLPGTNVSTGQGTLGYTDDATYATEFTIVNRHTHDDPYSHFISIEAPLPDTYVRPGESPFERTMCLHYYTSTTGGRGYNMADIDSSADDDWSHRHFTITKVDCDMVTTSARTLENREINVFSMAGGTAETLHTILRNEHVIVLVNVKYNPKRQVIETEVSGWNDVRNEIDFN